MQIQLSFVNPHIINRYTLNSLRSLKFLEYKGDLSDLGHYSSLLVFPPKVETVNNLKKVLDLWQLPYKLTNLLQNVIYKLFLLYLSLFNHKESVKFSLENI